MAKAVIAIGPLQAPRILCLHGGGVNAQAFRLQCRSLSRALQQQDPHCHGFRLVFADAPYESAADPNVLPAFQSLAPFRRWLRWKPEQPDPGPHSICTAIYNSIEAAVQADAEDGATGSWIAVMGFSQGAKVAASLLLMQQIRDSQDLDPRPDSRIPAFRFGIFLAGRAPIVALEPDLTDSLALADANELTTGDFSPITGIYLQGHEHVLRVPTLHVHGLNDPGIDNHRRLRSDYCQRSTSRLLEWDGDHRVPIDRSDVAMLADEIIEMARKPGIN